MLLSPSLNYLNVLGALAKGDECLASAPEDGLLGPKDLTGLDAAPLPTILDLLDTTIQMEIIVKKREIREGRREERMKGGMDERIETEKCLQVNEGRNKSYNNDLYLLES